MRAEAMIDDIVWYRVKRDVECVFVDVRVRLSISKEMEFLVIVTLETQRKSSGLEECRTSRFWNSSLKMFIFGY
jgi:hypothetical protein